MGNAASIGRELRADLSKTISKVMLLAESNLREATPVDTTLAASSWILSTGRPSTEIGGSHEAPSTAAQDAGIAALQHYDVGRDGRIYLTNNVEYLQHLDDGSSPQAEAGFVARAFAAAASGAPYGRKGAVRKMLAGMARHAFLRTE